MNPRSLRAVARRLAPLRRGVLAARFGDVRRVRPLTAWGEERGTPVDRYYIESYLRRQGDAVSGHVLEVKEDLYATALGASSVDVVDIDPANPRATVVGDLCNPDTLGSRSYDTVLVTQTLQYLPDPVAGLQNLLGSLRPGGSLLITVPCLQRVDGPPDLWRWTPTGLSTALRAASRPAEPEMEVVGLGNGLAARAFLFGLAVEDLDPAVLAVDDPAFPLVVGAHVRQHA